MGIALRMCSLCGFEFDADTENEEEIDEQLCDECRKIISEGANRKDAPLFSRKQEATGDERVQG